VSLPVSLDEDPQRRLGIVGAGKIGTAVARAAVAASYNVVISGSGAADRIRMIVEVLAPGAHAATTEEVAHHADLIVLAVPMHSFRTLAHDLFAGKVVVDAMNYWEEIDGDDDELATAPLGTSVVVQKWFPSSKLVKSLNHLGYFKFGEGRRPRGASDRLAMAAAGNDSAAVAVVMDLIDRLGFDSVYAGSLDAGVALQPDGAVFGVSHSADELAKLLAAEA
jgi:predicted dinucleotide-binding enzyme